MQKEQVRDYVVVLRLMYVILVSYLMTLNQNLILRHQNVGRKSRSGLYLRYILHLKSHLEGKDGYGFPVQ